MYEILCTYTGIATMMQDRFFNQEEVDKGQSKKRGKDAWRGEWPLKAYVDKKTGHLYVPADNIRMMLIGNKLRVGAAKILGSYIEKKKATEYLSLCESFIFVKGADQSDTDKVFIDPRRKLCDEDYDERSFINAAGSRSLTRRPIIREPWSLTFRIQVLDDTIDPTLVRDLFNVAGLRCGVCAYGPTFGRCVIHDEGWIVKPTKEQLRKVN